MFVEWEAPFFFSGLQQAGKPMCLSWTGNSFTPFSHFLFVSRGGNSFDLQLSSYRLHYLPSHFYSLFPSYNLETGSLFTHKISHQGIHSLWCAVPPWTCFPGILKHVQSNRISLSSNLYPHLYTWDVILFAYVLSSFSFVYLLQTCTRNSSATNMSVSQYNNIINKQLKGEQTQVLTYLILPLLCPALINKFLIIHENIVFFQYVHLINCIQNINNRVYK